MALLAFLRKTMFENCSIPGTSSKESVLDGKKHLPCQTMSYWILRAKPVHSPQILRNTAKKPTLFPS